MLRGITANLPPWTPAEDATLRAVLAAGRTYPEAAAALPGRSANGVRKRAAKPGLAKAPAGPPVWTPERDARLRGLWPSGKAGAARVLGTTARAAETRAYKLGILVASGAARQSPAERFEASTWRDDRTGCLTFTGRTNRKGVPVISAGTRGHVVPAAKFAWERRHGPVPAGYSVKRSCPNPACVEPAHHFLSDDPYTGRTGAGRPKLSDDVVVDMRERYFAGTATPPVLAAEFDLSLTHC